MPNHIFNSLRNGLRRTRLLKSAAIGVQFFCLIHLLNSHLLEITPSTGSSMLPTLAMDGDYLLHLSLPFAKALDDLKRTYRSSAGMGSKWQGQIDRDRRTGTQEMEQKVKNRLDYLNLHKSDQSLGTGLKVGDLVVSKSPTHPKYLVCKRVLGLPGDTVLVDPRIGLETDVISASSDISPRALSQVPQQPEAPKLRPDKENESLLPQTDRPKDIKNNKEIKSLTIPKGHVFLCGDNLANSTDSRHYGPVPLGLIRGKVVARVSMNDTIAEEPSNTKERAERH